MDKGKKQLMGVAIFGLTFKEEKNFIHFSKSILENQIKGARSSRFNLVAIHILGNPLFEEGHVQLSVRTFVQ